MFRNCEKKHSYYFASWMFWSLISVIPGICQAGFQDPTRPDYPKQTAGNSESSAAEEKLVLSAIWISAAGKWATINGVTAKQGQTILNKIKIIKIDRKTVSLSYNGSTKKLHLLRPLYKSQ